MLKEQRSRKFGLANEIEKFNYKFEEVRHYLFAYLFIFEKQVESSQGSSRKFLNRIEGDLQNGMRILYVNRFLKKTTETENCSLKMLKNNNMIMNFKIGSLFNISRSDNQ